MRRVTWAGGGGAAPGGGGVSDFCEIYDQATLAVTGAGKSYNFNHLQYGTPFIAGTKITMATNPASMSHTAVQPKLAPGLYLVVFSIGWDAGATTSIQVYFPSLSKTYGPSFFGINSGTMSAALQASLIADLATDTFIDPQIYPNANVNIENFGLWIARLGDALT